MNKIKKIDKKIYDMYYDYNDNCKLSKFSTKIALFFLHLDTLISFLEFSVAQSRY